MPYYLPARAYGLSIHNERIVTRSGRVRNRFVNYDDPSEVVVFADGTCQNNGSQYATAEFIVVDTPLPYLDFVDFNVPIRVQGEVYSRPLQTVQRYGEYCYPTSQRAKLQAAITALQKIDLEDEGFDSIVVACDLKYVVSGITSWINGWIADDWLDSNGRRRLNCDLFKTLLSRIFYLQNRGISVRFLQTPRLKGPRRR
jgi:ribonuclease HI